MNILGQTEQISPSIYTDNSSLDRIRQKASVDTPAAIKAAAKEFESFFMNMMLKSMRQASEVMGEESMFSSPQEKMFVGMLDEQMSVELSQKGSLGIAELLTRNLLPTESTAFELTNTKVNSLLPLTKNIEMNTVKTNNVKINEAIDNIEKINPVAVSVTSDVKVINSLVEVKLNKTNEVEPKIVAVATKESMFDSIASFVEQLMPLAKNAADKIGIDPKILLAQAALETGWGKHVIHNADGQSSFNLFGIKDSKSWSGESVKVNTLEVEAGEFVKRKEKFRSYSSFENSFNDFISFISENPRYDKAMKMVGDAKQFIQSIQDAGYATDPQYANKIINIFNRNLTK